MAILRRVMTLAVLFLVFFVTAEAGLAQLRINELSASNSSVLQDEDGDFSDWIELHNPTTDTLYLSNLFLSDDDQDLQKFALPPVYIPPSGYHVLFASDKNRLPSFKAWETPIKDGSVVRYTLPNALTSSRWIETDFNDDSWTQGVFGLGYGDDDDATDVPTGTLSIFTRSSFTISDPSAIIDMMLHIDYDDAFVAYLNGVEIARDNITGEAPLPYNAPADNYTEPRLPYGNPLWSASLTEHLSLLKAGENILAIQVHNFNSTSSDLSLRPFLSLGYNQAPTPSVGPADLVELPSEDLGYMHTNFKLSSSGETIYLTTAEGEFVDSLAFPPLLVDESFGRTSDQSNEADGVIFNIPTPNYPNVTQGYTKRLTFPELSHYGGFYSEAIELKAYFGVNPTAIYYTLDGSTPTQSDQRLPSIGITINETTVVRLRAIEPNALPSPIHTETFFIDEQHNLPIVSVSTDPKYLWSDTEGIYVVGTNGTGGNGHDNANWNQDWEIPIGFELYDQNKVKQIETGAGAKIMGGWSRLNPMKSLAIFFRSEYGLGEIEYKLFENKDISRFESIVLRNAGNDFTSQGNAMMRDGLMQTLVHNTEIDGLGFQPAVVYLNGEYWGIHNIREKINEHYVESNSGVDSDNIDLLYNGSGLNYFAASHGSAEQYNALIEYVQRSNLLFPNLFTKVEEMMDMDNYIDYVVAQIYYANTDWPGNNTKLWRERSQTGKWRWILYDTDFGFNLSYGGQSWHNTLDFALEPNGPGWPNPPWSTLLLRELFDSAEFRTRFVNRTADFINTSFKPDHVHGVIDSLAGLMYTEMPRHMANVTRSGAWGGSMNEWYNQLTSLKNFGTDRPAYIEQYYTQERSQGGHLGVGPLTSTSVQINDPQRGQIQLNRLSIEQAQWTGEYFGGVDIPVRAIPRNGFEFSGWTGDILSSESAITIQAGMNITAHFSPSTDTLGLVISEIMYNANNSQDSEDWIELYNGKNSPLDLTDWVVKDEDNSHEFRFAPSTTLQANEYAVIVRDSILFKTIYTHPVRILGQMNYALGGGGDQVRVFDAFGSLIDSVEYNDAAPWPLAADGEGYSLELIDLSSDNSLPQSWRASNNLLGSPGLLNGLATSSEANSPDKPIQFKLNQNYPNPFNPSTWISFSLPEATTARIEIYSSLGQKIMDLAEGHYAAGYHHIQWDADHFASGVYFYRLVTSEFSDTKKMLLVK
ncbi:CotH kinase family protein [Balneolaceae bacterium]|nr:CotH kinase family protein [Balneolaceae bacterium]